jgi:anti-sigma factor RsiW
MTERRPGWRDLNAYGDGELSPAEAARVAGAVAESPALADQVATLARLKATVQEQAEAPLPDELAKIHAAAVSPTRPDTAARRPWALLGGLAAAIAIIVLAAGLLSPTARDADGPAWRDLALRLHQGWAAAAPNPAGEPSAAALLASLTRLGQAAQVPDLSGARLTIGHLQSVASDYGAGLHVGYRGTRGCRVSLIILPAAHGLPEAPQALAGDDGQQHAWRVGGLGYALLASGMDPRHYAVVLKTVHEATRNFAPLGPETHTALAQSRARSRSCAA